MYSTVQAFNSLATCSPGGVSSEFANFRLMFVDFRSECFANSITRLTCVASL